MARASRAQGPKSTRIAILMLLAVAGAPVVGFAQDDAPVRPRAIPDASGSDGTTSTRPTQPGNNARPGAMQPGAPAGQPGRQQLTPRPGENEIVLPVMGEPLELRALVDYVAETLGLNIVASDDLVGTVNLAAPMTVRRDDLLDLLDGFLEHHGFTIVEDRLPGWYRVVRVEGVLPQFRGEQPTTRIIPTPTIRPTSLTDVINTHMGAVASPTGARPTRIAYLDDLGIIIITDTPRRIELLTDLIERVLARSAEQQFLRFELQHIAASVARQRVLELISQPTPTGPITGPGAAQAQAAAAAAGGAILGHLADRLSIDQQGNALILRGFPEEAVRVEDLLNVIDIPQQLEPRQYFAGAGAIQIAQMAERFGFGRVESLETPTTTAPQPFQIQTQAGRAITLPGMQQQQQQASAVGGGPLLVVDQVRGTIIYYGTRAQHRGLQELINIFEAERELVEIRTYKVKNLPAADVAEIIQGIVFHTQPVGTSTLLPGAGGIGQPGFRGTQPGGTQFRGTQQQQQRFPTRTGMGSGIANMSAESQITFQQGTQPGQPGARPQGLNEGPGALGGDDVFILADRFNNQVIVKAPAKQQEEFAALIEKLDQRRPQVYIEVQIVSVSATDEFRLAFETQLINADGRGGVFNTNFGLSGAQEDVLVPKVVPGLSGVTAALIKSDQVPIIINALRREADTRILSSPRLLVDDNEIAEIVSLELQPTTGTSQGTATTQITFTGFEEAGTRLMVTPSISDGGYLRLQYAIELSNFVGVGSTVQGVTIPPPKQTREVNSDSVTIPADTTIIVGGIQVDSQNRTVLKVPLLGDIPLIGHLFRDTGTNDASTRLYVFITPRILRDPTFRDLILLTKGPQIEAGIELDLPPLKPVMIELIDSQSRRSRPTDPPSSPTSPSPRPSPFDPYQRGEEPLENSVEN